MLINYINIVFIYFNIFHLIVFGNLEKQIFRIFYSGKQLLFDIFFFSFFGKITVSKNVSGKVK